MIERRLGYAVFAASICLLSLIAFQTKWPLVFFRFDGAFLLILGAMQKTWSIGGWDFTTNPLQGLGGLELPQHNLAHPMMWLAVSLPPSIGPTVAMALYAVLLGGVTCWLGRRMGMHDLAAIGGAWIGVLLAFPYVYPSLGFEFLWGVPAQVMLIALDLAVFLLLLDLGKGPRALDLARFVGAALLCVYEFAQFPNFAPVSLLVLGFYGIVSLAMAGSHRERLAKLAAGVALAVLCLALFGKAVYGLYGFAKPTFFWDEFYPRPGSFSDISFLVAIHSHWPAWLAYAAALAGGAYAAWRGDPAIRPFGQAFVLYVAVLLALVLAFNQDWRGPRIGYIDIFLYPFYCLFAAYAVDRIARWCWQHPALRLRIEAIVDARPRLRRHLTWAVVLSAIPWLALIDAWPPPLQRTLVRNLNPFVWPPAETPLVRLLKEQVAIAPGAPFRGRVASIAGSDLAPEFVDAPFINQHNFDVLSLFFTENDHRMYGLWYYGIPTMLEANQFSSPFFHVVNARLLNGPKTMDLRSYETQSTVNDRIMALFGVRYLLNDKHLPGREPVSQLRLYQGREIYAYVVPGTNVAGYSVTRVHMAGNAREVVAWMADPANDLRRAAALTAGETVPALVPASRSSLTVERGGYRVSAETSGTSLLVLPIEYSRCLTANFDGTGSTPPRLLRANLAMAAILFSGRLDGSLTLRYGPLSSECRLEDWREAVALRIAETPR